MYEFGEIENLCVSMLKVFWLQFWLLQTSLSAGRITTTSTVKLQHMVPLAYSFIRLRPYILQSHHCSVWLTGVRVGIDSDARHCHNMYVITGCRLDLVITSHKVLDHQQHQTLQSQELYHLQSVAQIKMSQCALLHEHVNSTRFTNDFEISVCYLCKGLLGRTSHHEQFCPVLNSAFVNLRWERVSFCAEFLISP